MRQRAKLSSTMVFFVHSIGLARGGRIIQHAGVKEEHLLDEGELEMQAGAVDLRQRFAKLEHQRLFGLLYREAALGHEKAHEHQRHKVGQGILLHQRFSVVPTAWGGVRPDSGR